MFLEPNEQVEDEQIEIEELTKVEGEDYVRLKRNHFFLILIAILVPLAFLAGTSTGYLLWGRESEQIVDAASNPGDNEPIAPIATEGIARFEVSTDDDPFLGPEDAPIVIIEFSDFNCGYCRRFHQDTFEALLDKYPDQIRFVYRDFPITSQESFIAAQAAQCAYEQGNFWGFHDLLFSGTLPLGTEAYETYAQELGLDAEELLNCIETERFAEEVAADATFASSVGLTGTPTFFVNGIPMVGAQPLEQFSRIIDEELGN